MIAGGCAFLELLNLLGHWYVGSCLIMLPLASGEVEGFGNGCSLRSLQLQSDDSIHQATLNIIQHIIQTHPSDGTHRGRWVLAELRGEVYLLVRVIVCRAYIRVALDPAIRAEVELFGNGRGQHLLLRRMTFEKIQKMQNYKGSISTHLVDLLSFSSNSLPASAAL